MSYRNGKLTRTCKRIKLRKKGIISQLNGYSKPDQSLLLY